MFHDMLGAGGVNFRCFQKWTSRHFAAARMDVLNKAAEEEAARKDEKPHPMTVVEAVAKACEVYNLKGVSPAQVKELDSYDDRNFVLGEVEYSWSGGAAETTGVVFKVHNGVESDNYALIEAHNTVLQHLRLGGVQVPEPLKIGDASSCIGWIDLPRLRTPEVTRKHAVRLLRFIPGQIIGQTNKESPELWKDVGRFVGKMDQKLLEIKDVPSPLRGRVFLWDLKNVPALSNFKDYIQDESRRELQQRVIAAFNDKVLPKIPTLRSAIIQNDANEANLIINEERTKVNGIIDFGDCLETCFVFEIAICMAYMMLAKDDPLEAGANIYAGYTEHVTLTQEEEDLLHILVCSRLVQSVTMSAYSFFKDPTNEYLTITATTGWTLLSQLEAMGPEEFLKRLKNP